ncbi:MAG: hydroxymethylbilane synthase [Deltaproteobacteria bacterium]|nr:hydroxymethylbilane synthase [Deltaproteobacteria bacterium]
MKPLRIATRASQLALTQTGWVARRIEERLGVATELVPLRTTGDRLAGVSLAKVGGKGLFVKELEEALLDGRADLAVHSAKDLPARLPEGLALVAFPERADPRDALAAGGRFASVAALPAGARVGTGSARRAAQLRAWRPELEIVPLRGNVPTRLEQVAGGRLDAVILACAGLERLGLADRIDERIAPERLLPAIGQGVLAIEARAGGALAGELAALSDPASARALAAERALLARLEGDCNVPLAGHAQPLPGGRLRLRALVAAPEGAPIVRAEGEGEEPEALGRRVADALLAAGAEAILAACREPGAGG